MIAPVRSCAVAWDLVPIEECRDGGAMHAVAIGEFVDRCATLVGRDQAPDAVGGEASLGRV